MNYKNYYSKEEVKAWGNQHGKGKRRKKNPHAKRNLVIFLSVIVALFIFGNVSKPIKYEAHAEGPKEIIKEVDNLSPKIDQLKSEAVRTIQKCESGGKLEGDGIITFDTNKKASIGTYQYQTATVIHYYQKLYGEKINQKEAILIALDDTKAEKLTNDIIFQEQAGWKNWYNCSKAHGIEAKVGFIKSLEQ